MKRTKGKPMPRFLTGAAGEIRDVMQWELSKLQLRRLARGDKTMINACDVIIAFDRVKAGGKHNTRRVFYTKELGYYVKYYRAEGGIVRILSPLSSSVFDECTTVYDVQVAKNLLTNEHA